MACEPVKPPPSPFSGFFLSDTDKTVLYLFLLTFSTVLKETWGRGQRRLDKIYSLGQGLMDHHSPWLWGSLTHWPCSQKRKEAGGEVSMQKIYCSILAQVPPTGWPVKVQPPQATSWLSGACGKWGLLPGLGSPTHSGLLDLCYDHEGQDPPCNLGCPF